MKTILTNGLAVTPDGIRHTSIVIDPPFISSVGDGYAASDADRVVDLQGNLVMPGVVDTHVHFRQPGMTHKATIATESRAAAAGGVTSILEMPNTSPTTTTAEALAEKQAIAARDCVVNHAFFVGATHDNADFLQRVDYTAVPGIKVFMGSSTGGMLLDDAKALRRVFSLSADIPVVTHCEDTSIINANAARYGDTRDFSLHSLIRSREACIASTSLALDIALDCNTRLHVAHISTAEEIEMVAAAPHPQVTGEFCVPHILFPCEPAYEPSPRTKCNPAVKTDDDRRAIIAALANGTFPATIATDHAPHLLSEKLSGGCLTAPSGMPMVQFSLPAMLNIFDPETVARLMAGTPAALFRIDRRGSIVEGNYADLAIVQATGPYTVSDADVVSLCGWTPLHGHTLRHRVVSTYVNGQPVYDNRNFTSQRASQPLRFDRN